MLLIATRSAVVAIPGTTRQRPRQAGRRASLGGPCRRNKNPKTLLKKAWGWPPPLTISGHATTLFLSTSAISGSCRPFLTILPGHAANPGENREIAHFVGIL